MESSKSHNTEFEQLEGQLGYHFENQTLLIRAITHRSFVNEHENTELEDNQRLEFLGDAVLGAITADELFHQYSDEDEGVLSARQSRVVRERALAKRAKQIDLGDYIRLGRGEARSGGRNKKSLLADSFEALIAAVYLDGGFHAAYRVVDKMFGEALVDFEKDILPDDFKSQLQNRAQRKLGTQPTYRIIAAHGPPHKREFEAEVYVNEVPLGTGVGGSKQQAEQSAARQGLEHFDSKLDF